MSIYLSSPVEEILNEDRTTYDALLHNENNGKLCLYAIQTCCNIRLHHYKMKDCYLHSTIRFHIPSWPFKPDELVMYNSNAMQYRNCFSINQYNLISRPD